MEQKPEEQPGMSLFRKKLKVEDKITYEDYWSIIDDS